MRRFMDDVGMTAEGAPGIGEALSMGGIAWEAWQGEIIYRDGDLLRQEHGHKINFRYEAKDGGAVTLGVVSDKYRIVQNSDAFAFAGAMQGLEFLRAGMLRDGRRTFVLGELPPASVLGEEARMTLAVFNGFDGQSAVRAMVLPVIGGCGLPLETYAARRSWAIAHVGDAEGRVADAAMSLDMAAKYAEAFAAAAEGMQDVPMTADQLLKAIRTVWPDDAASERTRKFNSSIAESIMDIHESLGSLGETEWRAFRALAQYVSSAEPPRSLAPEALKVFREKRFEDICAGTGIASLPQRLATGKAMA